MPEKLLSKMASGFREQGKEVLLIENPDRFLYRTDVITQFRKMGIVIVPGPQIAQRITFELRQEEFPSQILVFLSEDTDQFLEDIKEQATGIVFHLNEYLYGYHVESIKNLRLEMLGGLFKRKNNVALTAKETLKRIEEVKSAIGASPEIDFDEFREEVQKLIKLQEKDWFKVIRLVSDAIGSLIGTEHQEELFDLIQHQINPLFQEYLEQTYKGLITSNPIKKPKIVSKILDHLHQQPRDQKVALLVIDGLGFWQYLLLKEQFSKDYKVTDDYTHSWVPSVTELSRQAIFRGGVPEYDYTQNPRNEEKLWRTFWTSKGFHEFEIGYYHGDTSALKMSENRLALVLKDLDDKMHGSEDYMDLLSLTRNWIRRSKVVALLKELLENGYRIYLTTDHGNIQAKGWRNLKGREKLGTSSSRSQRHLKYDEAWIAEEFLDKNPNISSSIGRDENALYFKNDYSFSNKDQLITHGGSHFLEVLIPFIKIEMKIE